MKLTHRLFILEGAKRPLFYWENTLQLRKKRWGGIGLLTFKKAPVEQFFNTYFITYFTVNDTEDKLIFNSNLNGEMHIWAMDLPDTYPYLYGKVGGVSSGLTFDKENRFVVASFDNAGDENEQIYALPYDGGIPEPLITGPKEAKYFFTQLSKDGKRLYYIHLLIIHISLIHGSVILKVERMNCYTKVMGM